MWAYLSYSCAICMHLPLKASMHSLTNQGKHTNARPLSGKICFTTWFGFKITLSLLPHVKSCAHVFSAHGLSDDPCLLTCLAVIMIRCTHQCQCIWLQLVSLIALLLAWVYIFDTVQREREMLEGPKEGIIGAGGLQDPSHVAHTTTVFPPDRVDSSKAKDEETGEMSGQAVNIPPQMLVDSADGRSIGDMYAPMQGNISGPRSSLMLNITPAMCGCILLC